ncbi:DUF1835 domain-containing protein [Paraburkholderia caballeronis]|uniref:DUF1835 domain-containing protein n=1 Tax=Paraburkholderia caballeronis TaxID=416943 RepID=UPI001065B5B7|nr:DUF1835 domain-containing protein [Paraburkholderia caballeronis]TDV03385.1 uncharacterized protein DUF3658 [Paraburkholderia caballeronis]TDV07016.1 uncharacterized protein DUF3658 [Paraburkholderia caballeronis]TDV17055.1 uncharacterized protein DUF3658 [Paraburkholderia caballeronis]
MTTIHITCGEPVAAALGAALRDADRAGRVIALHDDLTVGPLRHADESAGDRVAFWQRAGGTPEAVLRGEAAMFDALEESDEPVVIWHTPDAADQLALRRVCYRLRNVPQRLNEVRLCADDVPAAPAASVAVARIAARLPDAAPISVLRITRLALEWQEARFANGETRRWRDNTFTSGTFADLDALIVEAADAARGEWLSPAQIGAALPRAGAGFTVREPVVLWRLRELAANGGLRLRDDLHAAHAPGASAGRTAPAGGARTPHLSLPR